ncbi:MAG: LytTR family DNA-binding domain-containing protein [Bacteroidota bacterium]
MAASTRKNLAVTTISGLVFLDESEIMYCIAEGSYTNVHLESGETVVISRTLGKVHSSLSPEDFVRIHNSFVININFTVNYSPTGSPKVTMADGQVLNVSRNRKKNFLEQFRMI